MPHGQLVLGPPGAGKSTYCYGLHQFLKALQRPITIVNLDPASTSPPYPHTISITSLITLQDVMEEFNLGPNGALLYCLDYLEKNIDWLLEELDKLGPDAYVAFDMPGQVELGTDHPSTKKIIAALEKANYRIAAVHLCDAHYITDASKYLSVLLLSLRTMLQLELPHVNVLSKVDLIASYSDLPFNLDFYTEVQDLSYLLPQLDQDARLEKYAALNRAICEVIEDFGLVGFETLCVEDKKSMIHLVKAVDQALGYMAPTSKGALEEAFDEINLQTQNNPSEFDPNQIMRENDPFARDYVQEVQERYIDFPQEYHSHDLEQWEKEGDEAIKIANQLSQQEAIKKAKQEE